jgi:hypothetical protein
MSPDTTYFFRGVFFEKKDLSTGSKCTYRYYYCTTAVQVRVLSKLVRLVAELTFMQEVKKPMHGQVPQLAYFNHGMTQNLQQVLGSDFVAALFRVRCMLAHAAPTTAVGLQRVCTALNNLHAG